ncbi:Aconitase/3-isopropylmalate dehydratase [Elaphomyces granulatus]
MTAAEGTGIDITAGFPEKIEGEILFLDADNINTNGIYPGKYTYQDDVFVEKMAQAPTLDGGMSLSCAILPSWKKNGTDFQPDIFVSDFNFGCGSSREQAETSIFAKKLPLVVCGGIGNTFSRNAVNNALPLLEMPRLVTRLRETFSNTERKLTRRTGNSFSTGPVWTPTLPPNLQDIIAQA